MPEASASCFKKEYLLKLEENIGTIKAQVEIKELPIKCQGRSFCSKKEPIKLCKSILNHYVILVVQLTHA